MIFENIFFLQGESFLNKVLKFSRTLKMQIFSSLWSGNVQMTGKCEMVFDWPFARWFTPLSRVG